MSNSVKTVEQLHDDAMNLALEGDKLIGAALACFKRAAASERQAFVQWNRESGTAEPTSTILGDSANALDKNCRRLRGWLKGSP